MKKFVLFFFSVLFLNNLLSQDSITDKKYLIKYASPILLGLNINERYFLTFEIQRKMLRSYNIVLSTDLDNNFALTPEMRFYLYRGNDLEGFFVGISSRFQYSELANNYNYPMFMYSTNQTESRDFFLGVGGGGTMGFQKKIYKQLYFDINICLGKMITTKQISKFFWRLNFNLAYRFSLKKK